MCYSHDSITLALIKDYKKEKGSFGVMHERLRRS